MADYSPTAANVGLVSGPTGRGLAGATVTRGEALYVDHDDDSKLKLADVDGTNPNLANVVGICLEDSTDDSLTTYARAGAIIDPGFTMTEGDIVVLSDTGNMSPSGDLTTGDHVSVIGVAIDTDRLHLILFNSGAVI